MTALLGHRELKQHDVVFDVHDAVGEIYFPTNAVISLVVPLSTGEIVETAMVGRDGVIAGAAALNGRVSLNRGVVQIGGDCLFCTVDALKALLKDHPAVRTLLGAHEQALFAQAQQSAACNATHVIESRLARWLLRAADLHGEPRTPAHAGVHRGNAGGPAHQRHADRAHFAGGGNDPLHPRAYHALDVRALQDTACECYQTVKLNYDALLHPSNR